MAENEDVQKMGADFSGLDEAVLKSAKNFQVFNKAVDKTISTLEDAETNLKNFVVTISGVDEFGTKMTESFTELEGAVEKVGKGISVSAEKMLKYQRIVATNIGTTEDFAAVQNELNATFLKTQTGLDRTNERLAEQAKLAAQLFAQQVTTKTTPGNTASIAEREKLASSIGKIQELVATGNVSLKRSTEIINEVFTGMGNTYVGAEAKIAAAAIRIRDAQRQLGAEFQKETEDQAAEAAKQAAIQQKLAEATARQAAKQVAAQQKVADASAKANLELLRIQNAQSAAQQKASDEALRQQQAAQIVSPLRAQFITPTIASPAEIARVTSALAKIQDLIGKGSVSAQRALQIIDATVKGTGEVFSGAEAQISRAAAQAQAGQQALGNEYRNLNKSMEEAGTTGKEAATKILLSWQQLSRLLLIQVLHSVISNFVNAIRSAITEAAEFQIKISEIRTISQQNQLSFEQWTQAVRGLSDQFGKPLGDVAKGLYETISNQMGQGAQAATFLADALRFSNAAVTSSENAVNLLSSALNAYNLSTGETTRVAASFFTTIDLGRVRADDLANSFGRIAPLAANLGISLDELNASIATITIQGVKPSEALTAINGVMTKLFRPTKEMTDQFKEWGVDSGRAAIATFGFEGVLKKLANAASEGRAEISELFNEIRATRGFVGITRVFDNFSTTLDKIKTTSLSNYLNAQAIGVESAGKKFEIETNKIKNTFIDTGATVVKFLVDVTTTTDATGKQTVHLAEIFNFMFRAITVAVGSFGVYKVTQLASAAATKLLERATTSYAVASGQATSADSLSILAIRTKTVAMAAAARVAALYSGSLSGQNIAVAVLTKSFIGLRTVVNAFGLGGVAIGAFLIYQKMQQAAEDAANFQAQAEQNLNGLVEERTKKFQGNIDKQTRLVEEGVKKQFEVYLQGGVKVQNLFNQIQEAQSKTGKRTADELKNAFDIATGDIEKNISRLREQATKAVDNIRRANEQIFAVQDNLEQGRFQRQVKLLEGPDQVKALLEREAQRRQLSQGLLTGGSANPEESATNLNKAIKENQDAERITNDLIDRRVESEKELKRLLEEIATAERKSADVINLNAEAERVRDLRRQVADAKTPAKKRNQAQDELKSILRDAQETLAGGLDDKQERDAAIKLAELKEQADIQKGILKILPNREEFEKRLTGYAHDQTSALQKYIALQEQQKAAAERAAEVEKQRLETLRDLLKNIAEFQITADTTDKAGNKFKVTSEAEKLQALKEFEDRVSAATGTGQLDANLLSKIADQRVQLERQADIQIGKNRFEQQRQDAISAREAIIKDQQDIATEEKRIITEREANLQRLLDRANELAAVSKKGNIATALGLRSTDSPEFNEAFKNFKDNPKSKEAAKALVDQFAELMSKTIASNTGISGPNADLLNPRDVTIKDGRTAETAQNEFFNAMAEIAKGFRDQTQADRAKSQLTGQLNQLGIKPAIDPTDDNLTKINKFGTAYIDNIAKTTQTVIDFQRSLQATASYLQTLTPPAAPIQRASGGSVYWKPRGTDRIPAMLSRDEYVVNAFAARKNYNLLAWLNAGGQAPQYFSGGGLVKGPVASVMDRIQPSINSSSNDVSVGDVHVHLDSSGSPTVDARQIGQAIKSELYYGRLNFNSRRR